MLKEGFDALYQEGAANGRLLVLNLHPLLMVLKTSLVNTRPSTLVNICLKLLSRG